MEEDRGMKAVLHCKTYKLCFMNLLGRLLGKPPATEDVTIKPSEFNYEMQLSTEERLEKLRLLKTYGDGENDFIVSPPIVVFQNFSIGKHYSACVTIKNRRDVPKCFKIYAALSPYFHITAEMDTIYVKLAPGMSHKFTVHFTPEKKIDLWNRIGIMSSELTRIFEIIAVSNLPNIDFPDHITVPSTYIKMKSEKLVSIYNNSNTSGNFNILVDEPFSVCHPRVTLEKHSRMNFHICFSPKNVGKQKGVMTIVYENGVILTSTVESEASEANVKLETDTLSFPDTFLNLRRMMSVDIVSYCEKSLTFSWKIYEKTEDDLAQKEIFKERFINLREYEKCRLMKLKSYNVIDEEGHSVVYDRICEDEIAVLDTENQFLFNNKYFKIITLTGEVMANSNFKVLVEFLPDARKEFECCAYLEIAGINNRLPLKMKGRGLGPKISLNISDLNVNDIFLCATHKYEVVAVNKGQISASVIFIKKKLDFGGEICCSPSHINLEPSECGAFILSLKSLQQGKFVEKIEFLIKESHDSVYFILSGNVICPLLSIDEEMVDFGEVAVGYLETKFIKLKNTSQVAIDYEVVFEPSGDEPPITCDEFSFDYWTKRIPDHPKEFNFKPNKYIVEPFSDLIGELTFVPNKIGEYTVNMNIYMWGSKKNVITIPFNYICVAPRIECTPSVINIRFCYINYPYTRHITLVNHSDVTGYIYFPQTYLDEEEDESISLTLSLSETFIKPFEEIRIDLDILTSSLNINEINLQMVVFGEKIRTVVKIICNGQGPVIFYSPSHLDFGNVNLLEENSQNLVFRNDSPISAAISLSYGQNHLICRADPMNFELNTEQTSTVTLSVYLTNPGQQTDYLYIKIANGDTTAVDVTCNGVGTMILCEPQLHPELNLGNILTHTDFSFAIKFTNKGKHYHKIRWSRKKILKSLKGDDDINSVFNLLPNVLELHSQESSNTLLTACNSKVGFIEEDFYCHAIIGKATKISMIISFIVTATFIEPRVTCSKSEITLRIDCDYTGACSTFLEDVIELSNDASIVIKLNVSINPPFYILNEDNIQVNTLYIELDHMEVASVCIVFIPAPQLKRCSVAVDYLLLDYVNHPKTDSVLVKGFVNYPTLSVSPALVNFGCITCYTSTCQEIILRNVSPLTVSFKWCFKSKPDVTPIDTVAISIPNSDSETVSSTASKALSEHGRPSYAEDKIIQNEQPVYTAFEELSENNKDIDPLPLESSSLTVADAKRIQTNEMNEILVPVLPKIVSCAELPVFEVMKNGRQDADGIFDIVPFEGSLAPYECCLVSIGFKPPLNTMIRSEAVCIIEGGEELTVPFHGKCSDVAFTIDTVDVDFGRKVHGDNSVKTVSLTNCGHGSFDYSINCDDTIEEQFFQQNEMGYFTVSPKKGILLPNANVLLSISFFPGITGEFNESFTIDIGFLDTVTIKVHALGVFSQIYLSLPRPLLYEHDLYLPYTAIASLTAGYLKSVKALKIYSPFKTNNNLEEVNLPKPIRKDLKKDNWKVISFKESCPTVMDIDLAVERMIVFQQFSGNDMKNSSLLKKPMDLFRFVVPAYTLDFGHVIVDTISCFTVFILNYGPTKTTFKIISSLKNRSLERMGVSVSLESPVLEFGEVGKLFVIFKPTSKTFPDLETQVDEMIYMEVKKGIIITIKIVAVVASPTMTLNSYSINFGPVRCGSCLRRSILLRNEGRVVSKWRASVQILDVCKKSALPRDVFFIKNCEDLLEPEQSYLLDVYFQPTHRGPVKAKLNISIEKNQIDTDVFLHGFGLKNTLVLNTSKVRFPAVLPYSVNEFIVKIQNVTTEEMELSFSDFDKELEKEEKILRIFMQCNRLNGLYIPYRLPGSTLPNNIIKYYDNLIEELRDSMVPQLIENQDSKGYNYEDEQNIFVDPLSNKNDKEIDRLLKEFVKNKLKTDINFGTTISRLINNWNDGEFIDPDPEEKMEKLSKCDMILIFHGAPHTGSFAAALNISKLLKIPLVAIDSLIKDALIENVIPQAQILNNLLQEKFERVSSESDLNRTSFEDIYDLLNRKIDVLLNIGEISKSDKSGKNKKKEAKLLDSSISDDHQKGRQKIRSKRKYDGKRETNSSLKSSVKSKTTSNTNKSFNKSKKSGESLKLDAKYKKKKSHTIQDISPDIFKGILREKFKEYEKGILLESLQSSFISSVPLALECVLEAIGNAKYIHLVLFCLTFNEFVAYKESNKIRDAEKNQESIHTLFLNVQNYEFDSIPSEHKDLYMDYVKKRKEITLAKREAARKRILEETTRKAFKKLGITTPSRSRGSKNKLNMSTSENEKYKKSNDSKSRKEVTSKSLKKGKKSTSSKSSKKDKSSKKTKSRNSSKDNKKMKEQKNELDQEILAEKEKFQEFEKYLLQMIHIAEYWDRQTQTLLEPIQESKSKVAKNMKGSVKIVKGSKSSGDHNKETNKSRSDIVVNESHILTKSISNGFPCWIVDNAESSHINLNEISSYLVKFPMLNDVLKKIKDQKESFKEINTLYSYFKRPTTARKKMTSGAFSVSDQGTQPEMKDVSSFLLPTTDSGKQLRGSTSSQFFTTSTTSSLLKTSRISQKKYNKSNSQNKVVSGDVKKHNGTGYGLPTRLTLEPGEIRLYKIGFNPNVVGNYKCIFTIEHTASNAKYIIDCEGFCDVPELVMDPQVLFPKVIKEPLEGNLTNVYVESTATFNFGSVVLNLNKSMHFEQSLTLINKSQLNCKTHVTFLNDECEVFYCQPRKIDIAANTTERIVLCAAPKKIGIETNRLAILICGNPRIHTFDVTILAAKLDYEISPKNIKFERVHITQTQKKNLMISNSSNIQLHWRILEVESALPHFTFSAFKGVVPPYCCSIISILYKPKVVEVISKRHFIVEIYDEYFYKGTTMYKECINITAESTETCILYEKEVNIGDIKTKVLHRIPYTITNTGKFNLKVEFSPLQEANNEVDKKIQDMFNITPSNSILQSNKSTVFDILFTPVGHMEFKRIPIFMCTFFDDVNDILILSFILKISARTFFSRYEVCPSSDLNFGHQMILTTKLQEIVLKNKGQFPFNFSISKTVSQSKGKDEKADSGKVNKKKTKKSSGKNIKQNKNLASKSGDSKKSREKKKRKGVTSITEKREKKNSSSAKSSSSKASKKTLKAPSLATGIYVITPSTGEVQPHESITIQVNSSPTEIADFEETIIINVSETQEPKGVPIKLSTTGCEPIISFCNYKHMFKQHYIIDRVENLPVADDLGTHSIYSSDENILYIRRVCLNTCHRAELMFKNNGYVAGVITAKFSQNVSQAFSVEQSTVSISLFGTCMIVVTFTPPAIEIFQAVLDITSNMGKDNKYRVTICGEGCLPEISLLEPQWSPNIPASMIYPPVFIRNSEKSSIVFKNTGWIPCQVILEVCDDIDDFFSLEPATETIPLLNIWDEESQRTMNHTNLVKLPCKKIATFYLHFKPQKQKIFNVKVKLHIVNNPFEVIDINIHCWSYYKEIIFNELQMRQSIKDEQEFDIYYNLNFGCIRLNTFSTKTFFIINYSTEKIFRFQFTCNMEMFSICPAIGHLLPNRRKEIIISVTSKAPIKIDEEILVCRLKEISYENFNLSNYVTTLSWDERQNFVPSNRVIEETPSVESFREEKNDDGFNFLQSTLSLGKPSAINMESAASTGTLEREKIFPSSTSSSENAILDLNEPAYQIINEISEPLRINIFLVCDFCYYECSRKEIELPTTHLFETSVEEFNFRNTGSMPIFLDWQISAGKVEIRDFSDSISSSATPYFVYSKDLGNIHSYFLVDSLNKEEVVSAFSVVSDSGEEYVWDEKEIINFSLKIEPNRVFVESHSTTTFKVVFTPQQPLWYKFDITTDITNLADELSPPVISVDAKSKAADYYFEFDETSITYESTRHMCGNEVDKHTKLVYFESIGYGVVCTKKFYIVNPRSDKDYIFTWSHHESTEKQSLSFHCHSASGTVYSTSKTEVNFSFMPQDLGKYEAMYYLFIKSLHKKIKFLLVGVARNPRVYFMKPNIHLRPTVVGMNIKDSVILRNEEEIELEFKFKKKCIVSKELYKSIEIKPLNGDLLPRSDQKIEIVYLPKVVGEANFDLYCYIEKMKFPLLLSVIGNCFEIIPYVYYFDSEGRELYLDHSKINNINVGNLYGISEKSIPFHIKNGGQIRFHYTWLAKNISSNKVVVNFSREEGLVEVNAVTEDIVYLKILNAQYFKIKIILQMTFGQTFMININAQLFKPQYTLVPTVHDFGFVIIQKSPTRYYETTFVFTNTGNEYLNLENVSLFNHNITVDFKSTQVAPHKKQTIKVYFHPIVFGRHSFRVILLVNSIKEVLIVEGQAVPVELEFREKVIKLGATAKGKCVAKSNRVTNKSNAPVFVIFDIWDRLPFHFRKKEFRLPELKIPQEPSPNIKNADKKLSKVIIKDKKSDKKSNGSKKFKGKIEKLHSSKSGQKSDKKMKNKKSRDSSNSSKKTNKKKEEIETDTRESKQPEEPTTIIDHEQRLLSDCLLIIPRNFVRIEPKQSIDIMIRFCPKQYMKSFTEKIFYETQDYIDMGCIVKANVKNFDLSLDRTHIPFGNVIIGCEHIQTLILKNTGDVTCSYKWYIERDSRDSFFTISPMSGRIDSHSDDLFKVVFKPELSQYSCRSKIKCTIQGRSETLEVLLTGTSIDLPPPVATLTFNCPVKEITSQMVKVTNLSTQPWLAKSKITGIYFSTSDIYLEGLASDVIKVLFRPVRMSTVENPHKGTLFVYLPEGRGEVYLLEGIATEPLPLDTIEKTILCKLNHLELLVINNWLSEEQRFHVISELVTPVTPKTLYNITGHDYMTLPPAATKTYSWIISIVHEGTYTFKVKFVNEATQEFCHYNIILHVTYGDSLAKLEFVTCVRKSISRIIPLHNIVDVPVIYTMSCPAPYLRFEKEINLKPYTSYDLKVDFHPLKTSEIRTVFVSSCKELGRFEYQFVLIAKPPTPEMSVFYQCCLGQHILQNLQIKESFDNVIQFSSKFDNPEFTLEKAITVEPNKKSSQFSVQFEPSRLGTLTSELKLFSPIAGEYIYLLVGEGLPPKPQGPFHIKPGQTIQILFKNPFTETTTFKFNISEYFQVNLTMEVIKPKKSITILVTMLPLKQPSDDRLEKYITGKLIASCDSEKNQEIQWVYYLLCDMH